VDPLGVRLVYAGRTGQSPLGQRADRNQTTDHGVGVLATLGHRLDERLVAVGGRLHGVVVVPGQHTRLEWADNLGPLTDRTNILGGDGTHAARTRLAHVPVGRAVLPVNGNGLAFPVLNVPGPNDRAHLLLFLGAKKKSRTEGPRPPPRRPPASQTLAGLLITLQKHLELCII